jgi:hypothetical protein
MMKMKALLVLVLFASSAAAEPMQFEAIRNGGNCPGCAYTQATGEITLDTPMEFENFVKTQQFGPGFVRLNSPGGDLAGGIMLGEIFRRYRVGTEVGSSSPILNAIEPGLKDRAPGVCASACAYAFLGGDERSLDVDAKLGFHRFYKENALAEPTAQLFTGKDLDATQRTTAALVL